MKGPFARFDRLCIARAASSLPDPLGPSISTVAFVGATLRIIA